MNESVSYYLLALDLDCPQWQRYGHQIIEAGKQTGTNGCSGLRIVNGAEVYYVLFTHPFIHTVIQQMAVLSYARDCQIHFLENLYVSFSPKLNMASCYEYY